MGDYRCFCKIEMEAFGLKDSYESYLNWYPDEIHPHIIGWMKDFWSRACERFDLQVWASQQAQRENKEKEQELQELARLKAKYEPHEAK